LSVLSIIGLVLIGFIIGMTFEGQNQHRAIDSAIKEEMDYVFLDESYRNLSNHRIYIPEGFDEIGAYRGTQNFPLIGKSDENGNIIIEMINVPSKIDTLSDYLPSDVLEEL
jgi:hypothetical protein